MYNNNIMLVRGNRLSEGLRHATVHSHLLIDLSPRRDCRLYPGRYVSNVININTYIGNTFYSHWFVVGSDQNWSFYKLFYKCICL